MTFKVKLLIILFQVSSSHRFELIKMALGASGGHFVKSFTSVPPASSESSNPEKSD